MNATINSQNELTAFNSSSANQSFDPNGNTVSGSTGAVYKYNAWNQMTSATVGSTTENFFYDALGQRITLTSGSTTQYQYYSSGGQVIETDTVADGTGSAISQYVWGLMYVNDLLVRDDNAVSGYLGGGTSDLGRRLFAIEDANFDVMGLVSGSSSGAVVVQRYEYTPYGVQTVYNISYGALSSDSYHFGVGFQGGLMDRLTGLVHFDARDYDPVTGRWLEPEPYGGAYVDGVNLYQGFDSHPTTDTDPGGLNPNLGPNIVGRVPGSGAPIYPEIAANNVANGDPGGYSTGRYFYFSSVDNTWKQVPTKSQPPSAAALLALAKDMESGSTRNCMAHATNLAEAPTFGPALAAGHLTKAQATSMTLEDLLQQPALFHTVLDDYVRSLKGTIPASTSTPTPVGYFKVNAYIYKNYALYTNLTTKITDYHFIVYHSDTKRWTGKNGSNAEVDCTTPADQTGGFFGKTFISTYFLPGNSPEDDILTAQILDNIRREINTNYPANLPGDLDSGDDDGDNDSWLRDDTVESVSGPFDSNGLPDVAFK